MERKRKAALLYDNSEKTYEIYDTKKGVIVDQTHLALEIVTTGR